MLSRKFVYYLYGLPNIVGCSLGLIGLGLYFFGIIDNYWLLIVLGLYGAGVIGTPSPQIATIEFKQDWDEGQVISALEKLMLELKGNVNNEIYTLVAAIHDKVVSLLPKLADQSIPTEASFNIRKIATDYLPETIFNYLKLPRIYSSMHQSKSGDSPKNVLIQQLTLLDNELEKLTIDLHQEEYNTMLSHGKFLQSKFGEAQLFE